MTNFPGVNWSTFFPKNVGERQQNYEAGQQRLAAIRDWYRSFNSPNQLSLPDNFRLPGFSEFGENVGNLAYEGAVAMSPVTAANNYTREFNKAAFGTEDRAGPDGNWQQAKLTGKERRAAGLSALEEAASMFAIPAAGTAAALKYNQLANPSDELSRLATDLATGGTMLSKSVQDVAGKIVPAQKADPSKRKTLAMAAGATLAAVTPDIIKAIPTTQAARTAAAVASPITDALGKIVRARELRSKHRDELGAFDAKYEDPDFAHENMYPGVYYEGGDVDSMLGQLSDAEIDEWYKQNPIIDPVSGRHNDTSIYHDTRGEIEDKINYADVDVLEANQDYIRSILKDFDPAELRKLSKEQLNDTIKIIREAQTNTPKFFPNDHHRDLIQAEIRVAKAQLADPKRAEIARTIIEKAEKKLEKLEERISKQKDVTTLKLHYKQPKRKKDEELSPEVERLLREDQKLTYNDISSSEDYYRRLHRDEPNPYR